MTKRRLAIVGLGMALGPHLKSLAELADRVEIAACFTPSDARRRAFAATCAYPLAGDLDDILDDASIEIVVLLTPPNTHLELIERCAAARKHVLIEKPVEGTLARARAAVAAMERAGRTMGVVLQHRFRPASLNVAARVSAGELGAPVSGSASIRWWRPPEYFAQAGRGMKARDGGGVLLTQAIHTLDLFGTLVGPIDEVASHAVTSPLRRIDTEDIATATLSCRNGAIGVIDATTVAYPGFPERIDLAGTLGTAVLQGNSLALFFPDGTEERVESEGETGGGADPMAFDHAPNRDLIADFAEAVRTGRLAETNGHSALQVHYLIDALLTSAAEHRFVRLEGEPRR
jgi:UDP-N-acetyl-2-amino-2-deoxyglucuronate dehydrogenase